MTIDSKTVRIPKLFDLPLHIEEKKIELTTVTLIDIAKISILFYHGFGYQPHHLFFMHIMRLMFLCIM